MRSAVRIKQRSYDFTTIVHSAGSKRQCHFLPIFKHHGSIPQNISPIINPYGEGGESSHIHDVVPTEEPYMVAAASYDLPTLIDGGSPAFNPRQAKPMKHAMLVKNCARTRIGIVKCPGNRTRV